MKRSVFIRSVALSSMGIGILPKSIFALPSNAKTAPTRHWMRQLGNAFATRRRSDALVAPAAFRETINVATDILAQHNYHSKNDTFHFFGANESWCFFPVYAAQAMPDGLDLLLPVFHRDAANNWHQVKTLTAYQVEALSKASHALGQHTPNELIDMLMPALNGGHDSSGVGYFTKSGMVSIKTTVLEGKATSTCKVSTRDGQLVFNETAMGLGLKNA